MQLGTGSSDDRGRPSGTTELVVHDREGRAAIVALARRRGPAVVDPAFTVTDPGGEGPDRAERAAVPDPEAWPASLADRAARSRWLDRDRSIVTVRSVRPAAPEPGGQPPGTDGGALHLPSALADAGPTLRRAGIRRIDLRVPAHHPGAAQLAGAGWVTGRAGSDVVASLTLAYPWNQAVAGDPPSAGEARARRLPGWVPPRLRRGVRRALRWHPGELPELARVAWAEAGATVRTRTWFRGPGTRPAPGAPEGATPFGGARHRTIQLALALTPPGLRTTTLIDIGAGDGRALAEAARAGFSELIGREIDPVLADTARRRLGGAATVEVGDALAADLPDTVGVVYLNNPFVGPAVARLADLVAESLRRRPRPLLVIYLNPPELSPLEAIGLVAVHAEPRFTVLATPARPGPA